MYLTFRNKYKGKQIVKITDPIRYLLSKQTEGVVTMESLSDNDFITIKIDKLSNKFIGNFYEIVYPALQRLDNEINYFLQTHPDFKTNKEKYYTEFKIPKRKPDEHGNTRWRHLINPHPELKILQRHIKETLENINLLPTNAAHAFIKNRDYYTNAEVHKDNVHIINIDLKNFFDTITEKVLYNALLEQPIFNVDREKTDPILDNIITIATYKGSTPQGSPLSPYLSNIIMVPFDYNIRKKLNQREIKTKYTRYADDMTFSSKKSQDITEIIKLVETTLNECYNRDIKMNYEKTKKITPGRCFITGVKLNQKHELTTGWEKKKQIKSRMYNLAKSLTDENIYTQEKLDEFMSINGYLAFMHNIEPEYTNYLINKYNWREIENKFNSI